MPFSKLGPAVGLSPAATRRRTAQLIEQGVMQIVAVTDPLSLGLGVQAWIGLRVVGDLHDLAGKLAAILEIEYVAITTGRFDIIVEVVCEDQDNLSALVSKIRRFEQIASVEVFIYLKLVKQTYDWGVS